MSYQTRQACACPFDKRRAAACARRWNCGLSGAARPTQRDSVHARRKGSTAVSETGVVGDVPLWARRGDDGRKVERSARVGHTCLPAVARSKAKALTSRSSQKAPRGICSEKHGTNVNIIAAIARDTEIAGRKIRRQPSLHVVGQPAMDPANRRPDGFRVRCRAMELHDVHLRSIGLTVAR